MSGTFAARVSRHVRQDWFTVLMVALVMALAQWALHWVDALEYQLYDAITTRIAAPPNKQVAIVAIDADSVAQLGALPWPRERYARLIDQLTLAKAKVIVPVIDFSGKEPDRGLAFVRQIKALLGVPADDGTLQTAQYPLAQVFAQAERVLDGDARLMESVKSAGNVILPTMSSDGLQSSVLATGPFLFQPDSDGVLRRAALLSTHDGQPVQSLTLLAVAAGLGVPVQENLKSVESIQLGSRRIPIDPQGQLLVPLLNSRGAAPVIAEASLVDVLSGQAAPEQFADKIVFIGLTAHNSTEILIAPSGGKLSPTQALAQTASSLMTGHFIEQPAWGHWLGWCLLLLTVVYLVAALPLLAGGYAAGFTSMLIFASLISAEFFLLAKANFWIELLAPAALLLVGHLSLGIKNLLKEQSAPLAQGESEKTRRLMALALQGQGELDMAFERLRRVPFDQAVMADLYGLALAFEQKQQAAKAMKVYQHMATFDANFRDIQARINPTRQEAASSLPTLGRYRVEQELGKGAMGVVYMGRDPTIGRVVAIKTMALSEEFEGEELAEVRERFFREAEAAGRLQHQNIVTIFDAGEDRELAYIAMEYLKGRDLGAFCKVPQLLPVPLVLSIAARVADALGYAHQHNIVHRDIKPANIMFDPDSDTLKVADFGIARIVDSSKTKTGLVLGTPSFMSPEQLAGQKVDGRTDIYSLGVLMYQMLTGVLPFNGSSLADLMHQITHQAAPDIRVIRPELSQCVAHVVAVSLRKSPGDRWTDGQAMAQEIRLAMSELTAQMTSNGKNQRTMQDSHKTPEPEKSKLFASTVSGALPEFEKTAKFESTRIAAPVGDATVVTRDITPNTK